MKDVTSVFSIDSKVNLKAWSLCHMHERIHWRRVAGLRPIREFGISKPDAQGDNALTVIFDEEGQVVQSMVLEGVRWQVEYCAGF